MVYNTAYMQKGFKKVSIYIHDVFLTFVKKVIPFLSTHRYMLIVLVISIILYYPDLVHFFAVDDFVWIWNAEHGMSTLSSWVQAFTHINGSGQYRPLSLQFFFWVSYRLFGLNPFGYHLLNFLVFLLSCWFVYKLVLKLTKLPFISAIGAGLFSFSTIHFEHIFWVSAFTETLATLFVVLALYAAVKRQSTLVLLWYLLGLLSNETTIILPALIALYYLIYERLTIKETLKQTWRLWIVLILYMILRLKVFGGLGADQDAFTLVISLPVWTGEIVHSILSSFNLNVHLLNIYNTSRTWKFTVFGLIALGATSLIVGLCVNIKEKTVNWRLILVGVLWFVVGLLPVLPFANDFADYTIAIPLIGVPLMIYGILGNTSYKFLYLVFGISVLCLGLIATFGPYGLYHNDGYRNLAQTDQFAFNQMRKEENSIHAPLRVSIIGPDSAQGLTVLGYIWTAKLINNDSVTTAGYVPNANVTLLYHQKTLSFTLSD